MGQVQEEEHQSILLLSTGTCVTWQVQLIRLGTSTFYRAESMTPWLFGKAGSS